LERWHVGRIRNCSSLIVALLLGWFPGDDWQATIGSTATSGAVQCRIEFLRYRLVRLQAIRSDASLLGAQHSASSRAGLFRFYDRFWGSAGQMLRAKGKCKNGHSMNRDSLILKDRKGRGPRPNIGDIGKFKTPTSTTAKGPPPQRNYRHSRPAG